MAFTHFPGLRPPFLTYLLCQPLQFGQPGVSLMLCHQFLPLFFIEGKDFFHIYSPPYILLSKGKTIGGTGALLSFGGRTPSIHFYEFSFLGMVAGVF